MTTYDRVLTREDVAPDLKEKLSKAHNTLNLLLLIQKIATLKKKIKDDL